LEVCTEIYDNLLIEHYVPYQTLASAWQVVYTTVPTRN